MRRLLLLLIIVWLGGFAWFALTLPQPRDGGKTDAVIVLTGGEGRIARGLEILRRGRSRRMLVSGVDRDVRPREFEALYAVAPATMKCCVTLDAAPRDTTGNARESARWIAANRVQSVRLVTSDWHMRRAVLEFRREVPDRVILVHDAVRTDPSLRIVFLEYNKLIARWFSGLGGG